MKAYIMYKDKNPDAWHTRFEDIETKGVTFSKEVADKWSEKDYDNFYHATDFYLTGTN